MYIGPPKTKEIFHGNIRCVREREGGRRRERERERRGDKREGEGKGRKILEYIISVSTHVGFRLGPIGEN